MIYTVTFNPALDYIVRVEDLTLGRVNRTNYEHILPGGKGINVFMAGFTGREIERRLGQAGIRSDFIDVAGMSRINVKVKSREETEINGLGPDIRPADIDALFAQLDRLAEGDVLVVSGSVPASLPADMYERILSRMEGRGIEVVVDATRDLLVNVLPYHPFLIKPNNHELGEIFGVELATRDEVVPYAKRLQERGAHNVLVSMAGEGAVFVSERGEVSMSEAPKGTVVNSVGAGDSMVAGFVAGWLETSDAASAFRMGLCTGSASAFSEDLATRPEVEALLATI